MEGIENLRFGSLFFFHVIAPLEVITGSQKRRRKILHKVIDAHVFAIQEKAHVCMVEEAVKTCPGCQFVIAGGINGIRRLSRNKKHIFVRGYVRSGKISRPGQEGKRKGDSPRIIALSGTQKERGEIGRRGRRYEGVLYADP